MENNESKRYNFFLRGGEKAVLLIHGITGTPSEMRYFGSSLNKAGYTVFCNTLPRHCSSLDELKRVTWQEIAACCVEDFRKVKKEYAKVFVSGISMGALMAIHLAYLFPREVSGIVALAPTLFYDGWALPKTKVLMNIFWHIPFVRNNINIRESWPYGLKDEESRENIERFYKNAKAGVDSKKNILFGSPFFPMACLYQHNLFIRVAKKELPEIKTPILILHSNADDMVSIRNAKYVYSHIGSSDKTLIPLYDSYHMITIDKDKDLVAQEARNFMDRI
ncbi:MAG: alpha/beta fold hydrolase [Candidatus Omnitrophota bacterium]|nr:alpha/beta fold hydrolase [Candidatus Omnitrophota bacterium]